MKNLIYTLLIALFSISAFANNSNKAMLNGKEVKILDDNDQLIHPIKTDTKINSFELIVTIKGKTKIAKTNEQVKSLLNANEIKGSSAILKIINATNANGKDVKIDDLTLTIE